MLKFYSEIPTARSRELLADLSTWAWVALWTVIGVRIHDAISGFAEAGRVLRGGGQNIQGAGAQLGDALGGLPLVGAGCRRPDDPSVRDRRRAVHLRRAVSSSRSCSSSRGCSALLVVAVILIPWLVTLRAVAGRTAGDGPGGASAPSAGRPSTCPMPRCSAPSRRERSTGCRTPSCSSTRPTRSATSRPATSSGWQRPSSPASACDADALDRQSPLASGHAHASPASRSHPSGVSASSTRRDRRHRGRRRRGPAVLPDERRQPPDRPADRLQARAGRITGRIRTRRRCGCASRTGPSSTTMSSSARRSRRPSTGAPASGIVVVGPWAEALSDFVGMPIRVIRCDRPGGTRRGNPTSIISDGSLRELAAHAGVESVDGRRFRMLIDLEGAVAHEEDGWIGKRIGLGDAILRVTKHDARCAMTTHDPETGEPRPRHAPDVDLVSRPAGGQARRLRRPGRRRSARPDPRRRRGDVARLTPVSPLEAAEGDHPDHGCDRDERCDCGSPTRHPCG